MVVSVSWGRDCAVQSAAETATVGRRLLLVTKVSKNIDTCKADALFVSPSVPKWGRGPWGKPSLPGTGAGLRGVKAGSMRPEKFHSGRKNPANKA